ncbi:MAG: PQQ-binding-like beta-propeller repeat protein [Planctomycetaceae bacterium]|nr:PQQ-binding-like beta-propeller repeat protein [Planctomycetaceae bacterium]
MISRTPQPSQWSRSPRHRDTYFFGHQNSFAQRPWACLFCIAVAWLFACQIGLAQTDAPREWTDSTGKFKVTATLIEVKDGTAFLKGKDGKTLKIPVAKLSAADQSFLAAGENPFMEEGNEAGSIFNAPAETNSENANQNTRNGQGGWNSEPVINWNEVETLDRNAESTWSLELSPKNDLGFTPKQATLNKLNRAFEDIRKLVIDPISQRAVAGYTSSFSHEKPESRLAISDLVSGKTIHTTPVVGDMCPIAILNDGVTFVMYGTSDGRGGYETRDQLQLWRLDGKKIIRTKSWIPFPNESESFGRKENGILASAFVMPNNRLVLQSNHGRLVCVDALTLQPYWQTQLGREHSVCANTDRTLLGVADGHTIMIIDPQTGTVKASTVLEDKPNVAWLRVRWSPSGTKLLYSFMSELRVLDLTSGQWTHKASFPGSHVLAPNEIDYPHDDYALVENRLLIHIPSQIKVCAYQDAKQIVTVGGTSFISLHDNDRGLIVPAKIPHPAVETLLTQAVDDPSVFLIRPGVEVAINTQGCGQWSQSVAESLRKAAVASGYKVVEQSPVTIVGSISGPTQEAVSYIAAGSYVANVYNSSIRLVYDGKDVWTTGGTNIPGVISTSQGQSIKEKLDELGKSPNLWVFENTVFPKILQKPSANQGPGSNEALMTSKFTMNGLVDSK